MQVIAINDGGEISSVGWRVYVHAHTRVCVCVKVCVGVLVQEKKTKRCNSPKYQDAPLYLKWIFFITFSLSDRLMIKT